jgi:hypothetical protein
MLLSPINFTLPPDAVEGVARLSLPPRSPERSLPFSQWEAKTPHDSIPELLPAPEPEREVEPPKVPQAASFQPAAQKKIPIPTVKYNERKQKPQSASPLRKSASISVFNVNVSSALPATTLPPGPHLYPPPLPHLTISTRPLTAGYTHQGLSGVGPLPRERLKLPLNSPTTLPLALPTSATTLVDLGPARDNFAGAAESGSLDSGPTIGSGPTCPSSPS